MSVEKYEDRIARENAERIQVQTDFNTKLSDLKIKGWELVPHISGTMSIKHHVTGACIFFTQTAWARNGKIEALATWPKSSEGTTYSAGDWGACKYSETAQYRIGFSFNKSAKAIARDLTRRLIPQVLEAQIYINEKIEAQNSSGALIADNAELLRKAFNARLNFAKHYKAEIQFDRGSATVSGSGEYDSHKPVHVAIELRDISIEQAQAIAEILKS